MDNDRARTSIIRAFASVSNFHLVRQPHRFAETVRSRVADCAVVGPRDVNNASTSPIVDGLRRDFVSLGLVVVGDTTASAVRDLVDLVRAGVDELVLVPLATRAELASALHKALVRRRVDVTWLRLAPFVPTAYHPMFQYCIAHSHNRLSVSVLAQRFGVDRSTLATRLVRAGLPPAHTILSWMRLVAVVQRLEGRTESVEQTAIALHFGSAAGLRAFTDRVAGVSPTELLRRGADSYVIEQFLSLLRAPSGESAGRVPRDVDVHAATAGRG